jgi:hypothetical protein
MQDKRGHDGEMRKRLTDTKEEANSSGVLSREARYNTKPTHTLEHFNIH